MKKKQNSCSIPLEYINEMLMCGTGFQNGKKRVYEMYQKIPNKKERIAAIKKEYGQGGRGWPLDGYGLHGYDTFSSGGKGIRLQWRDENGEHENTISWNEVEKHIGILIENNTYYCPVIAPSVITTDADAWATMFSDIPAELVS